jgi:O-antigen ligase/polysaccharide polymerase Wzy-like membrane protein
VRECDVESRASAANAHAAPSGSGARELRAAVGADGLGTAVRRLYSGLDLPISIVLAALVAAIAFVANGGLQLGSSTLVEVSVLLVAAVVAAAAMLAIGFTAQLHGGLALASLVAITALTGLSILWSLYPSESWVETNRTLSYLAAFGAGIAAVRLARDRWPAILTGILIGLTVVCLWGLATKVAPAWLAEHEVYGRLREPYGYWNAVGVTAAMAMPVCLWLGTRPPGRVLVNALAWPVLGLLTVTLLLSFSRGSIVAALVGLALWLVLVPLRLRSLAVLLPALLAAAAVTTWAFAKSALTDDRVALAAREDAGVELGVILFVMVVLLFFAGIAIQLRAERRPLAESTRRRLGIAAIAVVASLPLVGLGALAFSERGIGGTISDRWQDLTSSDAATPQNEPGRLTETSSVRSIYWSRAIDVWEKHPVAGAGAGSFAEAQLRFRDEPARGKHAHGYVLQTLADLGIVGLAISLVALAIWLLAARATLGLRRGNIFGAGWSAERTGLATLAIVVAVFGVHSALDWTWFVPAVAMTALFCAGWVAGRGPLGAEGNAGRAAGVPPLGAVRPSTPRRPEIKRRAPAAAALLAVAAVSALAIAQPWRAEQKGEDALRLADSGDIMAAREAAEKAKDLNPISVQPYFELAAVEEAAGNTKAATSSLEHAVQLQPASPETWRRLGDHYLISLGNPDRALPVLRAALFLDPLSSAGRASFVAALRASQLVRSEAAERQKKKKARRSAAP